MKNALKKHLSVSKKEWNGLVALITLITLVLVAPTVYEWLNPYKPINLNGFDAAAARLKISTRGDGSKSGQPALFHFNPNNLRVEQWEKLGLSEPQARVIKNYEAKGGRFWSKEDVKKIYSIDDEAYQLMAPYIDLPEKSTHIEKTNAIIEINSADTTKLMQIHGIGSGYATRIVRYRDRLGGFYNKEQLKEIFGWIH